MYRISVTTLLMVITFVGVSTGQINSDYSVTHDYLFPTRGNLMLTVATGVPYVGITEIGYGISDRFTVSAILGRTPTQMGYGFRIRGVIYDGSETIRVVAKMPSFYYPAPGKPGDEPWALVWPSVHIERQFRSGSRVSVGLGIVGAGCVSAMLGKHVDQDGFMGGTWNTVSAGLAVPVSGVLSVRVDVSAVMDGLQLAGSDWIGGPPVILNVGVARSF